MLSTPKSERVCRVIIVSGFPIHQTPRLVKEADALSEAGFEVHVLGATYNREQSEAIRHRLIGRAWKHHLVLNAQGSLIERLRWNSGRIIRGGLRKTKLALRTQFQYQIHSDLRSLAKYALKLDGDFYSLHLEPALLVAGTLMKHGKPFSFDFEDWHSENRVYGDSPHPYRYLREHEAKVSQAAQFITTTSQGMAAALSETYLVKSPTVIYNSFADEDFTRTSVPSEGRHKLSIAWFSQTIGPGRGIELLLGAVSRMQNPVEVHIRGNISKEYHEELRKRFALDTRKDVHFHKPCFHSELYRWLVQHDVGFASEIPRCKNTELTISNKILLYLQSGLAVIATGTAGQKEVANAVGEAIQIVPESPEIVARLLDDWAADRNRLKHLKRLARNRFENTFRWSESKSILQSLFLYHCFKPRP